MTPVGRRVTLLVLMARKSAIESVAVPFLPFRRSSSCMARMPNGVAALASPSMLAARFMIIAPMAGWSGGTSGKSRTSSGRMARAMKRSPPASWTTCMSPGRGP